MLICLFKALNAFYRLAENKLFTCCELIIFFENRFVFFCFNYFIFCLTSQCMYTTNFSFIINIFEFTLFLVLVYFWCNFVFIFFLFKLTFFRSVLTDGDVCLKNFVCINEFPGSFRCCFYFRTYYRVFLIYCVWNILSIKITDLDKSDAILAH